MNKIYKVIWSKVKNCYIVASELAKNHTKSPKSGVVGQKLENDIMLSLCNSAVCVPGFSTGVIAPVAMNFAEFVNVKVDKSFKITVAAIVKNEAENVPTWVQAARSCADEIVVVDTGSTDGTVERFADYGIKCFHYDWNDDFASAKNYMISLCHGDWIVLLDGDEWFREGCDVRKAIAKHHGNPITKAIIADWICLDKDRNNVVMFSGGAVRAFRNQPDVRYFRKVHENLTINYENFAFEPDFKMYHTGYSGSVNRSKHERNLRIMRTMFDFDNGKVEYPTDWRYIEDTYAGLGDYPKALWAADNMISFGVQEYSASAWVTKFNVLFAMKTSLAEMRKQFDFCFRTVPSVSGFRFLASIYYIRNGQIEAGLDNYIEGLRMLMGPQDKVAMEHTYWRMYMPEASALASAVYLRNKQFEASLYACKVCEQYCGQTDWTDMALADIRRLMDTEGVSVNIADRLLPVLNFSKKAVLATALISSLTVGLVKPVYAACCNLNEVASNSTTGNNSTVTGGYSNTVSGCNSSISGGCCNTVTNEGGSISGGYCNFVGLLYSYNSGGKQNFITPDTPGIVGGSIYQYNGSNYFLNTYRGSFASISGGQCNTAIGCYSSVSGGICNTAAGEGSSISGGKCNYALGLDAWVGGGTCGQAYACYSSVIGGGITGVWNCTWTAHHSVAIGQCATTTRDYEVAIGSACAPVKIGGNLTVTGTNTVTDGTTTKTWTELLNASGGGSASIPNFVINSTGNSISATGTDAVALGYNAKATGSNTVAIGSHSLTNGDNVVSFGHGAYTTAPDSTLYTSALYRKLINVADGTDAHDVATVGQVGSLVQTNMNSILNSDSISLACSTGAEYYSVAIGAGSNAGGSSSDELGNNIAIGHCATTMIGASRFTPYDAIAIGYNSLAQSNSVVLGSAAYSYDGGVAIGRCSYVAYGCSIAIGKCSTAMTDDVVSFGHKAGDSYRNLNDGSVVTHSYSLTRRLINISDGIDDSDAVTVGQLNTALASAGGGGSLPNTLALGTCGTTAACASGTNSIAIGEGALASGDMSLSIGTGNQVRGDNSGAIGDPNIVDANNSYMVGNNSTISANVDGAFVLGNNVTVNNGTLPANWDSLTDEEKSDLTGEGVIALGNNVSVSLCNKVNSSRSSDSTGSPKIQHVVAIGECAIVGEENAMALGYEAKARALNTFAGGSNASALSEGATTLGHNATVHENSSFAIAVGYEAEATGEGANAFGDNANAGDKFAVAFGRATNAQCEASTAIGNEAVTTGKRSVAIGNEAVASGEGATSIGNSSNAVTRNAVSIGNQAVANGEGVGVVAIGNGAQVGTADSAKGSSTAVGALANVQSFYSTALGAQTSVTANNSVALGAGSVASQANVVSVGAGTATDPYPATRKIINVTAGTADTDASTVGQTGSDLNISGNTLQLKNLNGTVLDSVDIPVSQQIVGQVDLENNTASGCYATVTGGQSNNVLGNYSTVSGGEYNSAYGDFSSISGGSNNIVGEYYSYVDYNNQIHYVAPDDSRINDDKTQITVGNSTFNLTSYDGSYSSITGGYENVAAGRYSLVANGNCNFALGDFSSIVGGNDNIANCYNSTIVGGACHIANGDTSTIVGGRQNEVSNDYASVFGGEQNVAAGCYSTITGGHSNRIGEFGFAASISGGGEGYVNEQGASISGGSYNLSNGNYSSVSGGSRNTAGVVYSYVNSSGKTVYVPSSCSAVHFNADEAEYQITIGGTVYSLSEYHGGGASVSGGTYNMSGGSGSSVSGGYCNVAVGYSASIAGGSSNKALNDFSFVAGGCFNEAQRENSTVVGGTCNIANALSASVVGGYCNYAGNYVTYRNSNNELVYLSTNAPGVDTESNLLEVGPDEYIELNSYYVESPMNVGGKSNFSGGCYSLTAGGQNNMALGTASVATGGCDGKAYANYSVAFGGGITGDVDDTSVAVGSIAIGKGATTIHDYEVAIGSSCAPVSIGGNVNVVGTNTVTDGTNSKSWSDLLSFEDTNTTYTVGNGLQMTGTQISAKAGTNVTVDVNGINVDGNGAVASGNTGLISGGTLFTEGRVASNGNYVQVNNTIAQNFGALDTQVKANADAINNNKIEYVGINSDWEEWNSTTSTYIKNKYGVEDETEYEAYKANPANLVNISGDGALTNGSIAIGKNARAGDDFVAYTGITSGQNAVAIGTDSYSHSNNSIAVGNKSSATQANTIAIGTCSNASYSYAVAIGNQSNATGSDDVALGSKATATGGSGFAGGYNAQATGGSSVSIGACSFASGNDSVAIGERASAVDSDSIAIGSCAHSEKGGVAIGEESLATTNYSVAMGYHSHAVGAESSAYGYWSAASGSDSTAVGYCAVASCSYATALGTFANASGCMASAIGYNSKAIGESSFAASGGCAIGNQSIAVGYGANANCTSATAVGNNAWARTERSTALGYGSQTTGFQGISIGIGDTSDGAITDYSIAIGSSAKASGTNGGSIALGVNADAVGSNSIVIGNSSNTNWANSVVVGYNSSSLASDTVVAGCSALSTCQYAVALGTNSTAAACSSVALGYRSLSNYDDTVSIGRPANGTVGSSDYMPEYTRRIMHVTAGTADTDAVNVKQLNDQKISFVSTGPEYWSEGSDWDNTNNSVLRMSEYKRVFNDIYGVYTKEEYDALMNDPDRNNKNNAGAVGNNSIAVGRLAKSQGFEDIAIGDMAVTGTSGSANIAIGQLSYAEGNGSFNTAIGYKSEAAGGTSIAIGDHAKSSSLASVTIGSCAVSSDGYSVTIGPDTLTSGHNSVTIGDESINQGNMSVAIGRGASVFKADDDVLMGEATAVGTCSRVTASVAEAYGYCAVAACSNASAIGNSTLASGMYSNALGFYAHATSQGALAAGSCAFATGRYSTAVGPSSYANGNNSVAIATGGGSSSDGAYGAKTPYSIAMGYHAAASGVSGTGDNAVGDSIAIGRESTATGLGDNLVIGLRSNANGGGSRVIGSYSTANGNDDLVFGSYSTANDSESIAVGKFINSTGAYSVAIGSCTNAINSRSIAIGRETNANSLESIAIGPGASVVDGSTYSGSSIAIGHCAYAQSANSISFGTSSMALQSDSIAIGNIAQAKGTQSSIAIGHNAVVDGDFAYGLSLGDSSLVKASHSSALGSFAKVYNESGTAVGDSANVSACYGVALGVGTLVTKPYGTALGYNAQIMGSQSENSIALGANSLANESNVLSLGKSAVGTEGEDGYVPELTRRIQHVTAGVNDTDAVNVKQLNDITGTLNTTLGNAVMYDTEDRNLVTMAATGGAKLTNLKSGSLTATSMDAINGSQLYAVKQDIAGFASDIRANATNIEALNSSVISALSSVAASGLLVDTLDNSKADKSLSNLSDAGKRILKTYAEDAVATYLAEQGLSIPAAPMAIDNGSVSNGNTLSITNAGNGSLHVGEGSYVNGTSSIAIGVGNQVNANNSGAFGDPSIINADESYVLGNDDTINTGATGSFIVGNDGVSDAKGGLLFGSNTKATIDAEDGMALGNRAEVSAKNAIALGSGSIANTENTLSIGNSNLKRKIMNVADGDISQNSSEVVTGAQLFATNEKVQQNTEAIEKKAELDASNIDVDKWSEKLATGIVEKGNTGLVNGGAVYTAIQDIKGNDLVQTNGDVITIGANNTATVIDVSNGNGQGRAITGVVTNANDASSAANVGYVNAITDNIVKSTNSAIQKVDNKVNKVGANAAAIANLPTPPFDGEEKWAFAAGVGHYQGETAGAVGAFYRPTDNVIARVSGSFGNGDEMVGAGVAVSLNKGNTPTVSKAQLVRTINAQAGQIQQQANEIQQVKQENAAIRAENVNMQQVLLRMQERLDALEKK